MQRRFVACVLAGTGMALLSVATLAAEEAIARAEFVCPDGKSIDATFYSGSVALKLSDGRALELPQVISASGARYANADESFVFWNKGDNAFITEGADDKQTYADCVTKD